MDRTERELRLYRRLCLFVGAVYLVWWLAVEALLPNAFNPLLGRLGVVAAIWAIVAASYASAWVRAQIRVLWMCALWLLTAHYFYLFYENAGDINWVVGSFITVTAVSLAFMSRGSLIAYSGFAAALAIGLVIELPALRHSVFVPGLSTVLLQANIGLNSRLGVLRDLAASTDHFQLLFDSTFEGVLIHEGGRIVQVNEALVCITGFTRDEMVGREAVELVHAADCATARDALAAGAASPVELRITRKDGTEVDVEIRGKAFAYRKRAQQLVTVEDVSERKLRAAELQRTNAALVRSNLDLQRFAYIASHDLQTPLRSIASFVDLLRSTYGETLDAQAKDWLARTSQSAEHRQMLIRDLLEYSRVDSEPRAFERVPMGEALERARALLDAAVRDADARITADELPEVIGDRSHLVQLLLNLLGNAIKYRGAEPPRIRVAAQTRGDDWLFEVRDNGIGIAPKHHQQVFDVFKRLHDQKQYPGTGIGLAICRRVVDRHGGKIWVESQVGEGSAFFFTIAKGTDAMNEVLLRGRPAVILLAEDNDNDVELTKLGFRRAKFAVELHHVSNGEECLAFLRKEGAHRDAPTPDIILLDRNMPRMDGIEVLQAINGDDALKHLVTVVLTSSKADEDVIRAYQLRCNSYLVKPIDFEAFAKMIESLGDYWFTLVTLPPAKRA